MNLTQSRSRGIAETKDILRILDHLEYLVEDQPPAGIDDLRDSTVFLGGSDENLTTRLHTLLVGNQVASVSQLDPVSSVGSPLRDTPACVLFAATGEHEGDFRQVSELASDSEAMPVMVVTERNDAEMCRQAFLAGGFDFIRMPESAKQAQSQIAEVLQRALEHDAACIAKYFHRRRVTERIERLTSDEQFVMQQVVRGHFDQLVSGRPTIDQNEQLKVRDSVLRKMKASNDVELVLSTLGLRD